MRILLNINVAEQLAGGAEAMQKAVSKWAGRDVGTDEMKAMMKDGKLIAKEILPLLSKEMGDLARNGDALKNALKGLAVIESRMKTTFDDMQANIYRGGLSEGLKDLYQLLDNIFWEMSQGESNTGKFLKGFVDGATESIAFVQAKLNDIDLFLRFRLGMDGVDMEMLGKAAYWISIAGAMNTIAGAMKIIFGGKMIEMIAVATTRLLGFGAAVATTEAAAAGVAATGAAGGMLGAIKGLGGRLALAAGVYAIYDWFANPHTAEGLQSGVDNLGLNSAFTKPTFQKGFSGGYPNFMQQQPQTGQVVVKLEMNENLRDIVSTYVENNNQKMIQTILPMGWTPTSNQ